MLDKLKEEMNKTTTLNMDKAYKSTMSPLLDFFSSLGAMRGKEDEEILRKFVFAFDEDAKLALKSLFYARDIRGGLGERNLFRVIINYLADNKPEILKPLVKHIPEYGRWDDLLILFNTKVEDEVIKLIKKQIEDDLEATKEKKPISLIGKWLPSENTSSSKTRLHAKYLRNKLEYKPKQYRKTLAKLREAIRIVEAQMSANEWDDIQYSKVPSKASMIYKNAFMRHDTDGYTAFLESVKKGETKINASTIYPYELYDRVNNAGSKDDTLEELWKALPNYVQEDENALVMADVSGSMYCGSSNVTPMSVSVSLALYFAERNKGAFANHFMTFSESPQLVEIKGSNVYEKMKFIERTKWGFNTDLRKAFVKILRTAVDNDVPQEELPKRLYVISDMQFDQGVRQDKSTFEDIKAIYRQNGYELPEIVFWNVNDYGNKPITVNDVGAQLVSGFSPIVFKQVVSGISAYDLMVEILNNERYEVIQ